MSEIGNQFKIKVLCWVVYAPPWNSKKAKIVPKYNGFFDKSGV